MSHLELPHDSRLHTEESALENAAETSPERRRVLRAGAQVLAAAGGLILARPFAARAQDAATTTTPATTPDTTVTTGDMGTGGDVAMAGGTMAGDQAKMLGARTGTEKATGMQPLAPADTQMGRAPIGSMSGSQGVPTTGMVRQTDKPGKAEENDAAILNFALTLEFLEAEFYTRAVEADDKRAFLRGRPKDLARALMRDEVSHVETVSDAIRKLGGTPVEKPQFQFPAEAFVSQIAFLQLSAQLEETGVSAYSGQGPNVKRKDVLNFAASIYGIEARHTGLIRFYLGDNFAPRDLELPLTMEQILERARPFIVS